MHIFADDNNGGQSGIYITNSKGFHIEDNDIYSIYANLSTGIYITESPEVNEIYRNRFDDLYTSIYADGSNTVPGDNREGLQIICNEFTNTSYDIYIGAESTIATYQGSSRLSAKNTFLPDCESGVEEFYNNGIYQINYFCEDSPEYIPYCSYNVNLLEGQYNDCPSKLGGGEMLMGMMSMLSDSIINTETELLVLIDGGDTEGMNETVDNTQPDEALKLRNELLSESPFLSDTVMINSTTIEDVLPALMLKQVLAENPSAAKSSDVQNALDNRQDPLPAYMRDEINLGRSILSEKDELQSNLSGFIHEREDIVNKRLSQLLRDSLPASVDTFENLLISENNLHRSYQLVNLYVTQNRINDAQNVFNNIPYNFELSSNQENEYNLLSQLFNIQTGLKNQGKTWFDMSDEEKQIVYTLAEDSTTQAGMRSRAVLSLVDNIDYGYPIPDIEEGGDKGTNPNPIIYPETFAVSPNPANDYFIIEYALGEKENAKDVSIALFDDAGAKLMNFELKTEANQYLIECEDWKEGIYWCRKFNKGKVSKEEKVEINRGGISSENNAVETAGRLSHFNDLSYTGNLFKIYPNPAKDYFIVSYDLKDAGSSNILILITDSRGRKIKEIKPDKNSNKQTISSSDWAKGVYTISLRVNENVIETVKLIIK